MPIARRRELWDRLATDLRPRDLGGTCTEVTLDTLDEALDGIVAGAARGRWIVRIGGVGRGDLGQVSQLAAELLRALARAAAGTSSAGCSGNGVRGDRIVDGQLAVMDAAGQLGEREDRDRLVLGERPPRRGRRDRARRRPVASSATPEAPSPASRADSRHRTTARRRSRAGRPRTATPRPGHRDDDVVVGVAATEEPQLDPPPADLDVGGLGERPVRRVDDDLGEVGRDRRLLRRRPARLRASPVRSRNVTQPLVAPDRWPAGRRGCRRRGRNGRACRRRPSPGRRQLAQVVEDLAPLDVGRARVDHERLVAAQHDPDVLVEERVSPHEHPIADLDPASSPGIVAAGGMGEIDGA